MRKTPQKKSSWRWVRAFLNLVVWGTILGVVFLLFFAFDLPDIRGLESGTRRPSITLLDRQGHVFATYGDLHGKPLKISQMSPYVPQAVIAIEDKRFYHHFGVDPVGLTRALYTNLRHKRTVQGGSTITQQLAKTIFLTPERTLKRKVQELLLSFWLEYTFTKDQILSIYLNRVYLGAGTYGIDAAAFKYFKKSTKDLNLEEAALLAGLLQSPSRYALTNNPEKGWNRAKTVLARMLEQNRISRGEYDQALARLGHRSLTLSKGSSMRYYADWIVGTIGGYVGDPNQDLVVHTTYDGPAQLVCEEALNQVLEAHPESNVGEGAVLVLSPSGAVHAMVGGRDYGASKFNRAAQAVRQPGSSFKTFIYLAALEAGYDPEQSIPDTPITFGTWTPKNSGWKTRGEVPLKYGMIHSINTVTVRLAAQVGVQPIIRLVRRFGISRDLDPNLTIALGASVMTPLEMSGVYATLANGGFIARPYGIQQITNREGQVLYRRESDPERIIDPQVLHDMRGMMKGVVDQGTGHRAKLPFNAYAKTGTSQENRDAWFMGFTDHLVAGVWLGNDDDSPMDAVGGSTLPAEIWKIIMMRLHG